MFTTYSRSGTSMPLDAASVAGLDMLHIRPDRQHFDTEFMTGDTGIFEERHLPQITTIIGSTNPHSVGFYPGHPGARIARRLDLQAFKLARFFKTDRFHNNYCPCQVGETARLESTILAEPPEKTTVVTTAFPIFYLLRTTWKQLIGKPQ